nr:ATP-binding protein [uncultured Rhodopila sp.]
MPDSPARAAPAANAAAPANYLDLYGLSKPPFGDSESYILFASHRRSFELLIDHMVNGNGLVVLCGESGIGKTRTLRASGDVAGESGVRTIKVSRPPNGRLDLTQFVAALLSQSDPELPAADTIETMLRPPHKALLIDDIDLLPPDCVHLIAQMLRPSSGPGGLAIVATSTADIAADTGRPELVELARQARNSVRLPRIGPAEARQYIERSLWVAGGTTRRLIAPDALKLVVARAGGLPDGINRWMEAAFTAGFARGDPAITVKTIAAATGPAGQRPAPAGSGRWAAAARVFQGFALGLLVIGATAFLYKGLRHHWQPEQGAAPPPPAVPAAPIEAAPAPPPPPQPVTQPAAPPPAAKPAESLAPDLMAAVMRRGEQSLSLGDIAAARLLFRHAADAGNARAAVAMGKTYDPDYLTASPAQSERPDLGLAAEWYRRAVALGDPQAADLLKRMEGRLPDTKR